MEEDNKKGNEGEEVQKKKMDDDALQKQAEDEAHEVQEVKNILDKIPEEHRKNIIESFLHFSSTVKSGQSNPIIEKFNDTHIHKLLDYTHEDYQQEFDIRKSNRNYYLIGIGLFIGVFIFLTIFLASLDMGLLRDVLGGIAIFAGGFGSGYGVKAKFGKK